jgi:uncharacterized membrane protein (Fun14 family)
MSIQFQLLQIDISVQQFGVEFGTGSVIGGLIGYAVKKVAKVIAVIVGIQVALFKLLESRYVIDVHWNKLGATFLDTGQMASANNPPAPILDDLDFVDNVCRCWVYWALLNRLQKSVEIHINRVSNRGRKSIVC